MKITTDIEYEAILDRIDILMDAEPGTSEEEELMELVDAVEVWEDAHWEEWSNG